MMNKKDTLHRLRELNRYRDTLVHTVCRLLPTQIQTTLLPHHLLEMRFDTPFKTTVTWHLPQVVEGNPQLLQPHENIRFYQVRRAHTPLSYHMHRFKLGDRLFLRRLWTEDDIPDFAFPIHQREFFLEAPR